MTDFQRYLHAKRTIDDRALDRRVLGRLREHLADREGLRVLDVGAGVGTMPTRLLDRGVLPDRGRYTAIDRKPDNVAAAREHLREWGFDDELCYGGWSVDPVCGDALGLDGEWDLLIGQAFLDLVDPSSALPRLFDSLAPGGLWYFPITFDGGTIFEPEHDLDDRVVELYHRRMDECTHDGCPGDHSTTGRRLFTRVPEAGGEILAAGSSDWVVHPPYPGDEAYFLHSIIDTIQGALADHPDLNGEFERWVETRHDEIDRGELTYIAHQIDVFGRI